MNTSPVLIDPSPERQILDFRPLGFHDVVVIGRYDYQAPHEGLGMHCHRGMIEICLLEKGRQVYVVEDREYAIQGGDVFITYPGELHGTGRHPESKGRLYWFLMHVPGPHDRFLSLDPVDWHGVLGPLLKRRPRKFHGPEQLKHSLDQIFEIHAQHQRRADGISKVNLQNWMLRFLLDTVVCASSPIERSPSREIQRVLEAVDDRIANEEDIYLKSLAAIAGLSLSRFKARFRSELGIPPAEYVVRRKIEKASEWLLEDELSITEIATRLQFGTSQYFATVYKRFTGKNPSQVRSAREIPPM